MKWWGWLLILALLVAHQDYWLWNDARPIAGFIPAGLAWHMLVSLLAAAAWWAIVRWSWPELPAEVHDGTGDRGHSSTNQHEIDRP